MQSFACARNAKRAPKKPGQTPRLFWRRCRYSPAGPVLLQGQAGQQFLQPGGALVRKGQHLAVPVFGHQDKTVVIIKKFGFVAVGKYLGDVLKAAGKAALHIRCRYIVPAPAHPVADALQAFLYVIQAHIIQAQVLPAFFRPPG